MRRRDVSVALFATTAGAALPSERADASCNGPACYPTTTAETEAGVSIADASYPPGYVDRYVKNVKNVGTPPPDMAPAFSAAFKVAVRSGVTVRFGATAPYAINSSIDYTTTGSPAQYGVTTRYDGGSMPGTLPLVATISDHPGKVDAHVFDCSGTQGLIFENVGIGGNAETAFFQARTSTGGAVGISRFMNCTVAGGFGTACYYNFGAEDDQIVGGYWNNTAGKNGSKVLSYTANNIAGCASAYQKLPVGTALPVSCIDHKVFGGEFYNESTSSSADVVSIEMSDSVQIFGAFMFCADPYRLVPGSGRSLVYVDMTHGGSSYCTLQSITGENNSTYLQNYGVCFSDNPQPCSYWTIDSCRFPNGLYAIWGENPGATLSNFKIRQISENTAHGIHFSGALVYSTIDDSHLSIDIGTVENSSFAVDTSKVSVLTRKTNLAVMEFGSTNRTWRPAVSGVSGISNAVYDCAFVGQQFTFNITWQTTTGISCSAGAYLTLNLPTSGLSAAAITTSPIPVVNATAHTLIGYGYVNGTNLFLPSISVTGGVDILIAGGYYVS